MELNYIGTDCFYYNFDEVITLSLSIDDNTTAYYKTLTDVESGTIVAAATRDTDSEYVVLEAKTDYKLCVDSYPESNETQTLFIRIVEDSNLISDVANNKTSLLSTTDRGVVTESNRRKFISSKDCPSCDLSGTNLSGADLNYANLSFSNLTYANISYANLYGARLTGTTLYQADLRRTIYADGSTCNKYSGDGEGICYRNDDKPALPHR